MNALKPLLWAGSAAALICALASCGGDDDADLEVSQGTVIQNVNVVNTRDGSIRGGMTVVFDSGGIRTVRAVSKLRISGSAQRVDGSGKYLVPGYLDMHTHALNSADPATTTWPLMIANGITGIREMSGSAATITRAAQLNADRTAGRIDAPEVVQMAGDVLVGVATAAQGVALVQQQKAQGAGFVKLVSASRDATLAILAEARTQGLGVAGHLSTSMTAMEQSAAGWQAIEHLGGGTGILLDCASNAAAIRQAILVGSVRPPFPPTFTISPLLYQGANAPFYQQVHDGFSESTCQSVVSTLTANGSWHVPTMIRLRTMQTSDDAAWLSDPHLRYVDPTLRALWQSLAQQYASTVSATDRASLAQYYDTQKQLLRLLKQGGAKMMAGTDLSGIWVIPGFSLHQEFRELTAAGLTPLEILQMTTLNGAEFLQRQASMGTVDEGKNADLVLLDADPIADAGNLEKIAAVVLRGKLFDRNALDRLKQGVADAAASAPLRSPSAVIDHSHVD